VLRATFPVGPKTICHRWSRDEIFSPKWMQTIASRIEREQPGWEFTGAALQFSFVPERQWPSSRRVKALRSEYLPLTDSASWKKYAKELPNILSGNGDKAASAAFRSGELVLLRPELQKMLPACGKSVSILWGDIGVMEPRSWWCGHLTKYAMDHNATPFYTTTFGEFALATSRASGRLLAGPGSRAFCSTRGWRRKPCDKPPYFFGGRFD